VSLKHTQHFSCNAYPCVARRNVLVRTRVLPIGMSAVGTDAIDSGWYDQCEQLLPSPQWPWFENGGLWDSSVPVVDVHEQVHEVLLLIQDMGK